MSIKQSQQLAALPFSLNRRAWDLAEAVIAQADALAVSVVHYDDGARVIDAGVNVRGGLDAGIHAAQICMAGLGKVDLIASNRCSGWAFDVNVRVSQAVIACLGAQYAGWSLSAARDDGSDSKWHGMGSGPARALCLKEQLFEELGFRDGDDAHGACAVLVIESDRLPPQSLTGQIATACGVEPDRLILIITPTSSLAGGVQIAARVVEVALHKAHAVGFDLSAIYDGVGATPLPPPAADAMTAMGRTNDTILFGATVALFVDCDDAKARDLAQALPSSNSSDYGRPFAQVFKDYDYDFFKVDPHLFSPAHVRVTNMQSGNTFEAGKIDQTLLMKSFVVETV